MAAPRLPALSSWRARTFAALEVPTFRRFWWSQLLSLVGGWMQATAQSYLVLELTNNDARALGYVNVAQFAPSLLFSLFAGALIDRLPKGRVLQATQLVLLLCALANGLLIQTGTITVPLLMLVAVVAGTANAFNMPTRQAMVADFVPRARLANAVALNSLSFNVSRTLGQALFGVIVPLGVFLVARGDPGDTARLAFPFYLNTVAFVVAMLIQATLPLPRRRSDVRSDGAAPNLLRDTAEGLRYVRRTKGVWAVMLLVGGLSVTIINFNVIIPYYAKVVYQLTDAGFGLLNAAFGAGAMIGALWQASKPNPLRNLRLGAVLLLVCACVLAVVPNPWLGGVMFAACGFSMLSLLVSANSTVQLSIPDALRGRVMSLYSFVLVGMAPPGALLSGALISSTGPLGPRLGVVALAVMGAVVVVALWRALPRSLPTRIVEKPREKGAGPQDTPNDPHNDTRAAAD